MPDVEAKPQAASPTPPGVHAGKDPLSAKQREKAGARWGKIGKEVRGLNARTHADVLQAGVPEEMRQAAFEQTRTKRLAGSDWDHHEEKAYGSKYKHETAEAAFGSEVVQHHLDQFPEAHAFISEWAYNNITGAWKAWGQGSNFVSPLGAAESFLQKAIAGDGISTLEKALGIPAGDWSDKGKTNLIYRFIIKNPKKLDIRMPMGSEGGAYRKEWVFGGWTLGKAPEAVVNAMKLDELKELVKQGVIEIKRVNFLEPGNARQVDVGKLMA